MLQCLKQGCEPARYPNYGYGCFIPRRCVNLIYRIILYVYVVVSMLLRFAGVELYRRLVFVMFSVYLVDVSRLTLVCICKYIDHSTCSCLDEICISFRWKFRILIVSK